MQISLGPAFQNGLHAFRGQITALEPGCSCVVDPFEYARCPSTTDNDPTLELASMNKH